MTSDKLLTPSYFLITFSSSAMISLHLLTVWGFLIFASAEKNQNGNLYELF